MKTEIAIYYNEKEDRIRVIDLVIPENPQIQIEYDYHLKESIFYRSVFKCNETYLLNIGGFEKIGEL
jgi:hypothetical protein